MDNEEYKSAAREFQIRFKEDELMIERKYSPERVLRWTDKHGVRRQKTVTVESSLLPKHLCDGDGAYVIFYPGFRREITREVNKSESPTKGQMVSNLLRSEHMPYNIFYPMRKDLVGAARLFNEILGEDRIGRINDIKIEYNPGGLKDGTAFDVFVAYTSVEGKRGAIGIEVKYTEKEYLIKRGSKEWNETHCAYGVHLADNYRRPSRRSGWFKDEYIDDAYFSDKDACREHVTANLYRQIWRNHLLGASMVLGLCGNPADRLDEFTSLTVHPEGNGHFGDDLWKAYGKKLTDAGKATIRHLTYERLFPMMSACLSSESIPQLGDWVDYLERRYNVKQDK